MGLTATRRRKDAYGRTWIFQPDTATWQHMAHVIGEAAISPAMRWRICDGPLEGEKEFKTLKEAQAYCRVNKMPNKETETITLEFTQEEIENLRHLVLNELKDGQKNHKAKTLKHLQDLARKEKYRFYNELFDLREKLSH